MVQLPALLALEMQSWLQSETLPDGKQLERWRRESGGTVDGDYGPRRKSANTYGGRGDDNLAMFRATNPSSATSKYRSATSRTSGHRLSPKSMEAEMNGLDALAAQAGTASAAASTKAPTSATSTEAAGGVGRRPNRSVNQPVSYAEPSLSSKIRKGHDFFPKGADGVGGPSTRVVSPAASPAMRQQPSSEAALM